MKVTFLDGQLFVICPPDGAVQNRPCQFVARACPSMPFYNVIETATKLVTDNVSITTVYDINDIRCVLQRAFVWLWQASLGN